MNYKKSSGKPTSNTSNSETNHKNAELAGWNYVCNFGSSLIYANGDKRRLVDSVTGEVIFEYTIGIKSVELGKDTDKNTQ